MLSLFGWYYRLFWEMGRERNCGKLWSGLTKKLLGLILLLRAEGPITTTRWLTKLLGSILRWCPEGQKVKLPTRYLWTNWRNSSFGHFDCRRFRYSFICQGTSTRRQRNDLFGLRVKLPPVTTSLTTQR